MFHYLKRQSENRRFKQKLSSSTAYLQLTTRTKGLRSKRRFTLCYICHLGEGCITFEREENGAPGETLSKYPEKHSRSTRRNTLEVPGETLSKYRRDEPRELHSLEIPYLTQRRRNQSRAGGGQHLGKGHFTFIALIFNYSFDNKNKIDVLKYLKI